MIEVSDYSPAFTQLASAGLEPGQTPIGVFYLLSEFAKIADHSIPVASAHARGNILVSYASDALAKEGFTAEMKTADTNFTEFKYSNKDVEAAIEAGRKDVHDIAGLKRIDLKGMTVIEKSLAVGPEVNSAYIIAFLNGIVPIAGKDEEVSFVYCCGWVRVKSKIVQTIYLVPLKDEKSVGVGRQALIDWMKAVEKAN
jgi:hypothetical protein